MDIKSLIKSDIRYRIALALDITDPVRFADVISAFKGRVATVKLGVSTLYSLGFDVIDRCREFGYMVFADVKLNDIPMQVTKAARAIFSRGVDMVTTHCLGGSEMLKGVVQASKEMADSTKGDRPLVLGVTILTSLDDDDLNSLGFRYGAGKSTLNLVTIAVKCGLDGVVCAAGELTHTRAMIGPEMLTVVPGIRGTNDRVEDQKRTMSPGEAINAGADILVIGRPILGAESPLSSLEDIYKEIENSL
ncbi:MAG: orotidine-5'-phosphate decarboxylase [Actinobacteria bacterium]|nr:orotidine-5'-phosphate decarboxylase [Actinomycetota bacterium]